MRPSCREISVEAADAEQRGDLLLDFAWPIVAAGFVVGVGIKGGATGLPEPAGIPLGLGVAILGILVLRSRTRRVAAGADGPSLIVRNVLWTYRIPRASVIGVITRRAWFGGFNTTCLGLRSTRRRHRLRSVPIHAMAAAPRMPEDLHTLLEEFTAS